MTGLSREARETIKHWYPPTTIVGYVRWACGGDTWYGDACGCTDDRCIGYHHDEDDDCGCLPVLLDQHVYELRKHPET
jgi:hypothetical protein